MSSTLSVRFSIYSVFVRILFSFNAAFRLIPVTHFSCVYIQLKCVGVLSSGALVIELTYNQLLDVGIRKLVEESESSSNPYPQSTQPQIVVLSMIS